MEIKEFIKHGLVRLPPGFRFHPTDEELVVQYLKRKALSCPLPAAIIPEIDLQKYNPWDLPGGSGEDRYFFYLRERNFDKKKKMNTKSGYWKPSGKTEPVLGSRNNELVGAKQVLVFYKGKPPHGSRTLWILHEYSLSDHGLVNSSAQSLVALGKDWVVCRIFAKRRSTKLRRRFARFQESYEYQATCSSSSPSCITDLSDEESINGEEATSSDHIV